VSHFLPSFIAFVSTSLHLSYAIDNRDDIGFFTWHRFPTLVRTGGDLTSA
jgi:hypothetical protein